MKHVNPAAVSESVVQIRRNENMDNIDKDIGCAGAKYEMSEDGVGIKRCRVYTRWVYDCDDCSFNRTSFPNLI